MVLPGNRCASRSGWVATAAIIRAKFGLFDCITGVSKARNRRAEHWQNARNSSSALGPANAFTASALASASACRSRVLSSGHQCRANMDSRCRSR